MSKYIDTFVDATVDSGSMPDIMTMPQAAVSKKKKVKFDVSLLNLEVTTALLTRPSASTEGDNDEATATEKKTFCTGPCECPYSWGTTCTPQTQTQDKTCPPTQTQDKTCPPTNATKVNNDY